MCINVVNLQTTKKKKDKKNDKKTTWTWSSKQGYKAACIILHRKYVYEWSRGSYWGLDRSHNKLSSSSVHRVYDNSPPLKIKKKWKKWTLSGPLIKRFFTIHTIILIALGFVKHAGNKIQAFQGHEQAQNDDAWRKTLKSLQSKKKTFKIL